MIIVQSTAAEPQQEGGTMVEKGFDDDLILDEFGLKFHRRQFSTCNLSKGII